MEVIGTGKCQSMNWAQVTLRSGRKTLARKGQGGLLTWRLCNSDDYMTGHQAHSPTIMWISLRRRSRQASAMKDKFEPMAFRRNYGKTPCTLMVKSRRLLWKKVPLNLHRWSSLTIFEIKVSFG